LNSFSSYPFDLLGCYWAALFDLIAAASLTLAAPGSVLLTLPYLFLLVLLFLRDVGAFFLLFIFYNLSNYTTLLPYLSPL